MTVEDDKTLRGVYGYRGSDIPTENSVSPIEETTQISYSGGQYSSGQSFIAGLKSAAFETAEAAYDLGSITGQKLGIFGPKDVNTFNFHDKMEAKQQEIALNRPNPYIFYPTSIGAQIAGAVALTVLDPFGGEVASAGVLGKLGATLSKSTNIFRAADSLGVKAAGRMGIVGRFGTYAALTAPQVIGSSVEYDKQGYAHVNPSEALISSGVALAGFGLFEGAGAMLRRSTFTKGSVVDKSVPDKPLPDKPLPDKPVASTESMNKRFIDKRFTPEQAEGFLTPKKGDGLSANVISSDLRHTVNGALFDRAISPYISESAATKLRIANIHHNGIEINGRQGLLSDALIRGEALIHVDKIQAAIGLNGARRVAHSIQVLEGIKTLPSDIRVKAGNILDDLFTKKPYRNTGSLKNPDTAAMGESSSPVWYYTLKSRADNPEALKDLESLSKTHPDIAHHFKALVDESNMGWQRGQWGKLVGEVRNAVENPMTAKEAEEVLADYRSGRGVFGLTDEAIRVKNLRDDILKNDGMRFIDDSSDSAFFVKAVAKLHNKSEAALKYFSCVMGV